MADWFGKLCRNMGLMLHNVRDPERDPEKGQGDADQEQVHTEEVRRTTEEKQVSPTTILRRTTIEEIEVRPGEGIPGPSLEDANANEQAPSPERPDANDATG